MDWTQVDIYTSTEGIEAVTGRLLSIGIDGFVIQDSADFQTFLDDKDGNWDYIDDDLMGLKNCETTVTVYLENNAQAPEMLAQIRSELSALKQCDEENAFGRLECELKNVHEQDWANNWKQYFKPIRIGNKLLVKPSWEKADSDEPRKILEIDPAASFGTGQHNTTKLCLELLEENVQQGDTLLDLGCGSGILSIAAVLLGAKSVCAVDIDDNAVRIAQENAQKNNIPPECYKAFSGNITADDELVGKIGSGYDVVCANIVADVLIAMSPFFAGFLKKGGKLVVSGIIDARRDEVIQTIKNAGFELQQQRRSGDWNAASFIYK